MTKTYNLYDPDEDEEDDYHNERFDSLIKSHPGQTPEFMLTFNCPKNWDQLEHRDDDTRYCSTCNINLYDLTNKTPQEVKTLLEGHDEKFCAKVYVNDTEQVQFKACGNENSKDQKAKPSTMTSKKMTAIGQVAGTEKLFRYNIYCIIECLHTDANGFYYKTKEHFKPLKTNTLSIRLNIYEVLPDVLKNRSMPDDMGTNAEEFDKLNADITKFSTWISASELEDLDNKTEEYQLDEQNMRLMVELKSTIEKYSHAKDNARILLWTHENN